MATVRLLLLLCFLCHSKRAETSSECKEVQEERSDALIKNAFKFEGEKPENFSMHLILWTPKVQRFDTKTNMLKLSYGMNMFWTDPRLTWEGDVDMMQLEKKSLWIPTVKTLEEYTVLENAQNKLLTLRDPIISSKGSICTGTTGRYVTFCQADLRDYPFDTQNCSLKLVFENVYHDEVGVRSYSVFRESMDHEWTLLSIDHTNHSMQNELCSTPHFVIEMTLLLKRNYLLHVYMYIIPSILVLLATLSLYWVPHHSKQRFSLAFGVSFGLIILSSYCSRMFPSGLGTSTRLVSCLMYGYILLAFTFTTSIITCNLFSRNPATQPIPPLLKTIFYNRVSSLMTGVSMENDYDQDDSHPSSIGRGDKGDDGGAVALTAKVERLINGLKYQEEVEELAARDNEWKRISVVIDRMLFHFLSFVTFICLLVFYA